MPRFVVLEHDHPVLHWDLLLERGPAAWTWRLDRLPPFEGHCQATRIPDHRLFYLDYEGPVGGDRGTVIRRLAGTFGDVDFDEPPDEWSVDLQGDEAWHVRFRRQAGDRWEVRWSSTRQRR